MRRTRSTILLCLVFAGCQLPAERLPVMPLPAEGQSLSYAEAVAKCRTWASAANEAFYVDRWADVDYAGVGLEKTAQLLAKSTDVPPKLKERVPAMAADLIREVGRLREAAKVKDVKAANQTLQQINLKVRELRPEG